MWKTQMSRIDEDLTIPLADEVFTIMNRTYKVENYGFDPVVHIFSRDQERKRVHHIVRGFPPYFYGGMHNESELLWKSDQKFPIILDILGRPVRKIETKLPKHTTKARKEFDYHCGASTYYEDRWYWDSGIRVTYKYDNATDEYSPIDPNTVAIVPRRIQYFDIETLSSKEFFADETVPNVPVIMIQSLDSYTKEVYVYYVESPHWEPVANDHIIWDGLDLPTGVHWPYKIHFIRCGTGTGKWNEWDEHAKNTERKMFKGFVETVERWDPDDFASWYGNTFDWQKLAARADELGIKETLRRVSPVNWYTIRGKRDDESKWSQKGSVKINGRTSVDMLELYKQQTKPDGEEPGYSLKEVLARRIGLVYDELGAYMQDLWHDPDGRNKLFLYGTLDVIGPFLLNEGPEELQGELRSPGEKETETEVRNIPVVKYRCMRMWDQPEIVRRLAGCSFGDTFKKVRMLHPLLWRYIPDRPIPTAKYGSTEEGEKVGGGFVFPPVVGLHEYTAVIDFSAMYPTIFISYNMGMDTLLTEAQVSEMDKEDYVEVTYDYFGVDRTVYFDLRFDSSLRILGRHLTGLRETYRAKGKEIFEAIARGDASEEDWILTHLFEVNAKFMANSIYGVNNYAGWPMYCPPVANSITGVGRKAIRTVAKKITEELPWVRVTYGDTDSVFLTIFAESLDEAISKFTIVTARINEMLIEISKELGLENPLDVKLEKIFNPIVFKGNYKIYKSGKVKFIRATKKRYMALEVYKDGEIRNPPKPVFVGLEAKRSDASPFVKRLQVEAGEMLLRERDTKAYVEYLRGQWLGIRGVDIGELGTPKGLKKHPTNYRPNAWTKACLYAMRVFEQPWNQTIKPKIVYIKKLRIAKRKYPILVPNCWRWKCTSCGSGDYVTDEKMPADHSYCTYCNGDMKIIPYELESVTSLTGNFDDIPDDFWSEWEVDYDKMREKVFKDKFADMCLSIGENWSQIEGRTTLDQFFG